MDSAIQEILLFLPLITLLGIGYVSVLVGYFPTQPSSASSNRLNMFLVKFPLPVIVFTAAQKLNINTFLELQGFTSVYGIIMGLFLVGGLFGFRYAGYSVNQSASYTSCIIFPNLIFIALPLFLSFDNSHPYLQAWLIASLISLTLFSLVIIPSYNMPSQGVSLEAIYSGLIDALHMPMVVGFIVGGLFAMCGLSTPSFIEPVLHKIAITLTGMGLITMGMGLDLGFFKKSNPSIWLTILLKTVVMPLLVYFLVPFFDLTAEQKVALMIIAACPASGTVAIVAKSLSDVSEDVNDTMMGSIFVSLLLFGFWMHLAHQL